MGSLLRKLIVGTRGSPLALRQTEIVAGALRRKHPSLKIEIRKIETSGDKWRGGPLADVGGKGLFVKEIEESLANKKIDCAVHSLKDLPGILDNAFLLAAFLEREDPRDCLVSEKFSSLASLPPKGVIGTSSPRRASQLKWLRPDCQILPLRGNVGTRLEKLRRGEYDALVMAVAGLKRLGLEGTAREIFEPFQFLPAVGQGVIALESRRADKDLGLFLKGALNDVVTETAVRAERAFLEAVGGSCYTPLAGYAHVEADWVRLAGWLGSAGEGKTIFRLERYGDALDPEALGRELAHALLHFGGKRVLHEALAHTPY